MKQKRFYLATSILLLFLLFFLLAWGAVTTLSSCKVDHSEQIEADLLKAEERLELYLQKKYDLGPEDYEVQGFEPILREDTSFSWPSGNAYSYLGHYLAQILYEGSSYHIRIPVSGLANRDSFFCDDLQSEELNADVRSYLIEGLDLQGYCELNVEACSNNHNGLFIKNYYDGQDFCAAIAVPRMFIHSGGRIKITAHYLGTNVNFEEQFKETLEALFPPYNQVIISISFVAYESEEIYQQHRNAYNQKESDYQTTGVTQYFMYQETGRKNT